ncbi:hypothetical protein F5878DRAFT_628571 [Lentinula raphanica]|uniref:Uncharacterized protein n=1 Tax=Lentinula raphanica TaxID=153919 RepID=A0AA38P2P3_9AGAR|nr:hypothetical protein F5878DRAFT_628571 [Lentinula raphanica]
MTLNDEQLLASFGQTVFFNILNLIVIIIGYGAFVLGTAIAILLLRKHSFQYLSRTNCGLLVCTVMIFICYSWNVIYEGGSMLTQIEYTFIKTLPEGGLAAQAQSSDNHMLVTWEYMETWPPTINLLLSDCIVAWRAWVLFPQEKSLKVVLIVLMVANIGINIADCIWSDIEELAEFVEASTLDWLSIILSLVVNACATFLIALKARNFHWFISDAHIKKKTRSQSILLLLVESGAIFCAIQTVYAVFILLQVYKTNINPGLNQAIAIILDIFDAITPCYPLAIIILVLKDASPAVVVFNQTTMDMETSHNVHSNSQMVPLHMLGSEGIEVDQFAKTDIVGRREG